MTHCNTLAVAICAAMLATPLAAEDPHNFFDLTVPDIAPSREVTAETYVDTMQRRECHGWPKRPGWVMVPPKDKRWAIGIARNLYWLRVYETVLATGDCSCDTKYPSWDGIRAEFHALTDNVTEPTAQRDLDNRVWEAKRTAWRNETVQNICRAQKPERLKEVK